jgi:hypothetical protein
MKKQLLIAAVAASMTSVAMADVSISGNYKATVTAQEGAATTTVQDLDMKIVAKGTAGTATLVLDGGNGATAGDNANNAFGTVTQLSMSTTILGLNAKMGDWKGTSGAHGLLNKAGLSTNKVELSTTVAGVSVAAATSATEKNASVTLAGNVAGFDVKVQGATASSRMISISGDIAGVSVAMERTKQTGGTNSAYSISGSTSGLDITYAAAKINATAVGTNQADDNIFGNISALKGGEKATALQVKTATAFGPATVKFAKVNGVKTNSVSVTNANVTYKYAKTTSANAKLSAKVTFKF